MVVADGVGVAVVAAPRLFIVTLRRPRPPDRRRAAKVATRDAGTTAEKPPTSGSWRTTRPPSRSTTRSAAGDAGARSRTSTCTVAPEAPPRRGRRQGQGGLRPGPAAPTRAPAACRLRRTCMSSGHLPLARCVRATATRVCSVPRATSRAQSDMGRRTTRSGRERRRSSSSPTASQVGGLHDRVVQHHADRPALLDRPAEPDAELVQPDPDAPPVGHPVELRRELGEPRHVERLGADSATESRPSSCRRTPVPRVQRFQGGVKNGCTSSPSRARAAPARGRCRPAAARAGGTARTRIGGRPARGFGGRSRAGARRAGPPPARARSSRASERESPVGITARSSGRVARGEQVAEREQPGVVPAGVVVAHEQRSLRPLATLACQRVADRSSQRLIRPSPPPAGQQLLDRLDAPPGAVEVEPHRRGWKRASSAPPRPARRARAAGVEHPQRAERLEPLRGGAARPPALGERHHQRRHSGPTGRRAWCCSRPG